MPERVGGATTTLGTASAKRGQDKICSRRHAKVERNMNIMRLVGCFRKVAAV